MVFLGFSSYSLFGIISYGSNNYSSTDCMSCFASPRTCCPRDAPFFLFSKDVDDKEIEAPSTVDRYNKESCRFSLFRRRGPIHGLQI